LSSIISRPSRIRESGVRRSCETPASKRARSSSSRFKSAAIWLKARASTVISDGPRSVTGCGVAPRPICVEARVNSRSGRLMRDTMK
jgi:hypothetical protein